MKVLILLAFLYLSSFQYQPLSGQAIPQTYQINLDLPPLQRWERVIIDYNESLWNLQTLVVQGFGLPAWVHLIPESLGDWYDQDFAEEISAIAELSGLGFGYVFFLNFMSQMQDYSTSTSIVTQNSDGLIIHGMNLDYDYAPDLALLSADAEFYKNGTLLYKANIIVGYVGILTGMKPNAFTITVNERNLNGSIWNSFWYFAYYRALPMTYLARKTLEEEVDYQSAYNRLSNTVITAPVYYILSGTQSDEGVVITRSRDAVDNYYGLNVTEGRWFLVQTNYDRDQPDPANDYRRIPAQNELMNITQENITYETLFDGVLAQEPNLNEQTILTCIMSSETGYFNATLWWSWYI